MVQMAEGRWGGAVNSFAVEPHMFGPGVVHAPRGGHASAPPTALVADAPHHPTVRPHAQRAPRITHHATHRARRSSPRIAPRAALHRAPRTTHHAAPRTTHHAPHCATQQPCGLIMLGPESPGGAARKKSPGAHPFFRDLFQGGRAKAQSPGRGLRKKTRKTRERRRRRRRERKTKTKPTRNKKKRRTKRRRTKKRRKKRRRRR